MKTATISKKSGKLIADKIADLMKEAQQYSGTSVDRHPIELGYIKEGLNALSKHLMTGVIIELEEQDKEQISKI